MQPVINSFVDALSSVRNQSCNMHHICTVLLIFFHKEVNVHFYRGFPDIVLLIIFCIGVVPSYLYGDTESPKYKLQEGKDINTVVHYYVPKIYSQQLLNKRTQ